MPDLVRNIVLAPCRWCKDAGSLVINHGEDWFEVACGNCGASGPDNSTEFGAITAWNTRVKQDEARDE